MSYSRLVGNMLTYGIPQPMTREKLVWVHTNRLRERAYRNHVRHGLPMVSDVDLRAAAEVTVPS